MNDDGLTPALKLLAAVLCTAHDIERASDACVAIESTMRCAYLDTPKGDPQSDQAAREIAAAYWMVHRLRTDLEGAAKALAAAHEEMKTDAERAKETAAASAESDAEPKNPSTTTDADTAPAPLLH